MTITLAPDIEAIVEDAIREGRYASQEELVRRAILLLTEKDREEEETPEYREYLRREVEKGLEDERQGRVGPLDIEEIKRLGRKQLEARQRKAS